MRLAFFSPLNPIPSGISDYSEELLPLLAQRFDVELIVDGFRPSNPALSHFRIRTLDDFKRSSGEFDLVLYQMGNSPAHDGIFRTLLEIPGVVVMHDIVLHHLRAWQTLDRGDSAGYIQAMREEYGDAGAELARLEALGLASLDRFEYPLNGPVVRAAHALIVHSAYASREIQPIVPDTPVAIIPMGIASMPEASKTEARSRLNLPAAAFIVAAFGEVHPFKRVTVALEAFGEFHARFPDALFLLVGRESPNYGAEALIRTLGLGDFVRRIGFAPSRDYADYVAAADVCLNLRYPTAGETSASLLRLFEAGKTVIVTRTGGYAELPDDVCIKIDPDEYERELLRGVLEFLAGRSDVREMLGANARSFVQQNHSLERAATAYADFLKAVVEKRAGSKSYLGEGRGGKQGDKETGREEDKEIGREGHKETGREADKRRWRPLTPEPGMRDLGVANLSSIPGASIGDAIMRDYADLGMDADARALVEVARAILELGLSEVEPRE